METQTERIFCNQCRQETNHICKGEHVYETDDELLGYRLYICAGCEAGVLEQYYTNEELRCHFDEGYGEYTYFPARRETHLDIKQFRTLSSKLGHIYEEVISAFNMDMRILCAIGIRALLEGICANKKIQGKNLHAKINGLGMLVTQNIVDNLHSIRFIGNAAAHELNPPTPKELHLAIEICEDLLTYLYDLDNKTTRLKNMLSSPKKVTFGNA